MDKAERQAEDLGKEQFWNDYYREEWAKIAPLENLVWLLQERSDKAVQILLGAGLNDGAHHKQAGITEAMVELLGGEEAFIQVIGQEAMASEFWDKGIPG